MATWRRRRAPPPTSPCARVLHRCWASRCAWGRAATGSRCDAALPTSEGEAAVTELTATLNQGIEDVIRRYPEQWVWMHQRWKSAAPDTVKKTSAHAWFI